MQIKTGFPIVSRIVLYSRRIPRSVHRGCAGCNAEVGAKGLSPDKHPGGVEIDPPYAGRLPMRRSRRCLAGERVLHLRDPCAATLLMSR